MRFLHSVSVLLTSILAPSSHYYTTTNAQEVISVHGSGTTNPQKCYWDIIDKLTKQSKEPIRLTYRGVGSSTGQLEFMGDDTLQPYNDFGSGDIPLSQENYDQFNDGEILHLPIMMGAISFFHSAPTTGDGKELDLTPCVLAQILNRKITDWTDDAITSLNPDLNMPSPSPITVARRVKGSSSTASITSYLHQVCPQEWPLELVGKTVNWKEDTEKCEGSSGMTTCINTIPGTIGYIDAGHGHSEGLSEIELQNADGVYLTSKKAAKNNGILAAVTEDAGIPDRLDKSFANANLLNQPGANTWPIVALTYVYVRKDITYLTNPESQSLLRAFLRALYKDQYTAICAETFGFIPVTGLLRDQAVLAIESIQTDSAPEWFFEEKTEPGEGQSNHVFSVKRDSYSEIEQDVLLKKVSVLEQEVDELLAGSATTMTTAEDFDRDADLTAALAMAAISMCFWFALAVVFVMKKCF